MIDDALLERWLSEVASEVPVPEDGAQRILAARDEMMPYRRAHRFAWPAPRLGWVRTYRTAAAWVAAAATIALLIFGASALSGGSGTTSSSSSSGAASVPSGGLAPTAAGGHASSGASSVGGAGGTSPSGGTSSSGGGNANEVPSTPPSKVIKTGSLRLRVGSGHIQSTVNQLSSEATGLGGFVSKSSVDNSPASAATGDVTVQVPVGDFPSYLAYAQRLGTTLSVTTSGQDVTSNYVDLQARIHALDDARAQYEQILGRARSIGDILSVESQISDLQTQIEQLQGQLNVLDNQTTYATLDVQITAKAAAGAPPAPAAKTGGLAKAWAHARHSFAHGIEAVVGALGGIAVFLVVVGLLVAIGRFGWVVVRRRLL